MFDTFYRQTHARKAAMDVSAPRSAEAARPSFGPPGPTSPAITKVRGPETGLVMVRGRAGGGGAPFNLGEATVSRASVRLATGEVGHGYCLGRDGDKAECIAADRCAVAARAGARSRPRSSQPLRDDRLPPTSKRRDETAATKVDFFTMVRGDD